MDNKKNTATTCSLSVSCATDIGPNIYNQDYYGLRYDENIILFENKRISHCVDIQTDKPFLAVVADGETLDRMPKKSEDDAQALAVNFLLKEQYRNYFFKDKRKHIANSVNEYVLNQSCLSGIDSIASVASIGIDHDVVLTMYMGNCAILRVHEGKMIRCTPVKMSTFNNAYVGNESLCGSEMAIFKEYPLCKGDIWILATDGVIDPFTLLDYSLDEYMITHLVEANKENSAAVLVKVSGETYYPVYSTYLCKDNRTAVVIRINEV